MIDAVDSGQLGCEFFTKVDALENPLLLLDPECGAGEKVQSGLSDGSKKLVRKRFQNEPGEGYIRNRRLSDPHIEDTYENRLNIRYGGFSEVINRHRKHTGKSAISVLDSGCGHGVALEQALGMDSVDSSQSVGITVHNSPYVPENARKSIVIANIGKLVPKRVQGIPRRFDTVLSVYGTMDYHPFNRGTPSWDYLFGFFHAINFTKVGGLIFTNWACYPQSKSIAGPIQQGILERATDFNDVAISQKNSPAILRVVRRPTLPEIKRMLRIGDDGMYDMEI